MAIGRLAPDAERVTFDDLVALIPSDYQQQGNRTWDRIEHALKHLRPTLERIPAVAINYDSVSRYIARRLDQGAAPGTVHHERWPPTLKLDNVRKRLPG